MKLNRQQIQTLVQVVAETNVEEIDCDEMIRVLTDYADKLSRGIEVDDEDDAGVVRHLETCPECREEYKMIRKIADEGLLGQE